MYTRSLEYECVECGQTNPSAWVLYGARACDDCEQESIDWADGCRHDNDWADSCRHDDGYDGDLES